jgi:hypothetical protein
VAVLGYQLAIIVTLLLVRLIAPKRLRGAALVWTALTVINLFWPPLIVLQLVVIWGTYGVLTRSDPPLEPPKPALDKAVRVAREKHAIGFGINMQCSATKAREQAALRQDKPELMVKLAEQDKEEYDRAQEVPKREPLQGPSFEEWLRENEKELERDYQELELRLAWTSNAPVTFRSYKTALNWARCHPSQIVVRVPETDMFMVKPARMDSK